MKTLHGNMPYAKSLSQGTTDIEIWEYMKVTNKRILIYVT